VLNNQVKITPLNNKLLWSKAKNKRSNAVSFTAAYDLADFNRNLLAENKKLLERINRSELTNSVKEGLSIFFNGIVDIITTTKAENNQDFFNILSSKIRKHLKNKKFLNMQDRDNKKIIKKTFLSQFFKDFLPDSFSNIVKKYTKNWHFINNWFTNRAIKKFMQPEEKISRSFIEFLNSMLFGIYESDFSKGSFMELKAGFELYEFRKIFKDIFKSIEKLKEIPQSEHVKHCIDMFIRSNLNKIHNIGLSKEVKEIVDKAKDELSVQMIIPNSEKCANTFYNILESYKKLDLDLPQVFNLMDLDFFTRRKLAAGYYRAENENYKREIGINFFDLCPSIYKEEEYNFYRTFRHEMVHLTDNVTVYDNYYQNSKKSLTFYVFPLDDLKFYKNILPVLKKHIKNPSVNSLELLDILENCIQAKQIQDVISNNFQDINVPRMLNNIIEKISNLMYDLKEYLKSESNAKSALENISEFKAYIMERSLHEEIPDNLLSLLREMDMPDMKDRCYLPDDHPVMIKIRNNKEAT
jgi:hypothetical protein